MGARPIAPFGPLNNRINDRDVGGAKIARVAWLAALSALFGTRPPRNPLETAGFFMLGRARFGLAPVGGSGEGNGVIFYGVVDDNLEEAIEFFTNRQPSVLSRAGTETSPIAPGN